MKKTFCLLLFFTAFAAFSFASAPAVSDDDPEEEGWSKSQFSFGFRREVSIKAIVDESFENVQFNYADDAKTLPMREFCDIIDFNVGKKDILWLDVYSKTKERGEPLDIDRDYFKITVLPSFIDSGYKRVVLTAGGVSYDTDADSFIKRRISDVEKNKNRSWRNPPKRYEKKWEKYSLEKSVPGNGDILERHGHISFEKLKELGEAGDDWALYFYATARMRHLPGGYYGDEEYPFNFAEGMEILKKLSEKGMRAAAEELALFYGLEGEYKYDIIYRGNRDDALALEYMKTAHLLGSRIFTANLIESACEKGDWLLADALAGNPSEESPDDENCDYDKARRNDRRGCALAVVRSVSKNDENWPSPRVICSCYQYTLFPYFGSGLEIKNPFLFSKWTAILAEESPYSSDVMFRIHSLAKGIGGPVDLREAFDVARRASLKSFVANGAQIAYTAYAYEKGLGVAKNEGHAKAYWGRFFGNAHHESGRRIAYAASCLYNGLGFPKDRAKALEIMEKCVEIALLGLRNEQDAAKRRELPDYVRPCADILVKIYSGEFDASEKDDEKLGIILDKINEISKLSGIKSVQEKGQDDED